MNLISRQGKRLKTCFWATTRADPVCGIFNRMALCEWAHKTSLNWSGLMTAWKPLHRSGCTMALTGIPSYVHYRAPPRGRFRQFLGETGYLSASPGFLHSALDFGNLGWTGRYMHCGMGKRKRALLTACARFREQGDKHDVPCDSPPVQWIRLSKPA